MGCGASAAGANSVPRPETKKERAKRKKSRRATRMKEFQNIPDQYQTLAQVTTEIRQAGLESSQLVIGVDFTKSNLWTGAESFNGKSLHDCFTGKPNPYQEVLSIMGRTLQDFDDDKLIPAYGFGDNYSRDRTVLPFKKGPGGAMRPCQGIEEVLERYLKIAKNVMLAGPTSFAPLIYEAIRIVTQEKQYHILVIIADGKVDARKEETVEAIVAASMHPISIIMVGVGDGPWDTMEEFDDELPDRNFDNFQFVCLNEVREMAGGEDADVARFEANFALAALMEIPDQYKAIQELNLMPRYQAADANMTNPYIVEDYEEEEEEDAFDRIDDSTVDAGAPMQSLMQYSGDINDEPPDLYLCPITHELMRDPVVAGDGFTYDRTAITSWISSKGKKTAASPMTGAPIAKDLIPNHSLRSEILSWMELH